MSDLFEESYSSEELNSSDESILSDRFNSNEKVKFSITWHDLTYEFKKKVMESCFFKNETNFLETNNFEDNIIAFCNFRVNQVSTELWREVESDKWIFKENNNIFLEKTAIVGDQVFFKIYSDNDELKEEDFYINDMASIKEAFDLAENKVHNID